MNIKLFPQICEVTLLTKTLTKLVIFNNVSNSGQYPLVGGDSDKYPIVKNIKIR